MAIRSGAQVASYRGPAGLRTGDEYAIARASAQEDAVGVDDRDGPGGGIGSAGVGAEGPEHVRHGHGVAADEAVIDGGHDDGRGIGDELDGDVVGMARAACASGTGDIIGAVDRFRRGNGEAGVVDLCDGPEWGAVGVVGDGAAEDAFDVHLVAGAVAVGHGGFYLDGRGCR